MHAIEKIMARAAGKAKVVTGEIVNCTVDLAEGEQIQGMVYQMCTFDYFPPNEAYFAGIRDAYESLGLRSEIKRVLQPALMRSYRRARN